MPNNFLEHFNNESVPGPSSLPENSSNTNVPNGKSNRISVIKNLGERIRSSLPNFRNHLKRLVGLKKLNNVNLSEEKVQAIKIDRQEQIVGSTSDETVADSSDFYYEALNNDLGYIIDTSSSSSSNYVEISIRPENLYEYHTVDHPSMSAFRLMTNDTSLESDRTEQLDINLSTILFPSISTTPLMISHSVNTSMDALTMSTMRNEDAAAIVAGNFMEFVATLYVPMGSDSSERIILEPRRVPLFLSNNFIETVRISGISSSGPRRKNINKYIIVAAPYCSMILGDLGVEITKLVKPGCVDKSRYWGPPFLKQTKDSTYFLSVNRNKKSVCVDLNKGKDRIYELAKKSDVLIENYVPGKLNEMALSYEDLEKIAPHLIYYCLAGYGSQGPYAKRSSYDVIAASLGGLLHITGPKDGALCKVGVAILIDTCQRIILITVIEKNSLILAWK